MFPPSLYSPLPPRAKGANHGLSVQNSLHPEMICGVLLCGDFENQIRPLAVVETGQQAGLPTAPRQLESHRHRSANASQFSAMIDCSSDRWAGISIDEASVLHSVARILHFSAVIIANSPGLKCG